LRCGSRAGYPLTLVNSELKVGTRTVLIGNAAQTLHPVAGQGFNLALRDASMLLQCLLDSSPETDPGAANLLADYRERRARDQQRVIRFTDGLVRLFSNDLQPLAHARSLGLVTMDLLPALRRRLVQQGMGINMPLPRIGRYRQ
jgi:2-octaprenyl-6-methoxyphenol hydroxylase